jgi:uncharacterized coiled-coil DUF342 family protein
MAAEIKAEMGKEVAALAKQRDEANKTVSEQVAKMEGDFAH